MARTVGIVMASTTPAYPSRWLGQLLPMLRKATGIGVKVVAVGTGQIIGLHCPAVAGVLPTPGR